MLLNRDNNISKKTKFLISLKNVDEISNEVIGEVDILDLKNPLKGAIGAWELNNIKRVISIYKNKITISATLGDVFEDKEFLIKLKKFDCLGLDFIKFGLLSIDQKNLFEKLRIIESKVFKTNLVCVVFVDIKNNLNLVNNGLNYFLRCGVKYILLDTFGKKNGDLLNFCKIDYLRKFISKCKKNNIKIGLAGGLKEIQIPLIVKLKPDIVGFRSAICRLNKRNSSIDINKIRKLSGYFNS